VSGCPDGRCDGSGFLYDESTRRARPCSCRPRRIARRKARKLAGVIPRRYQGVSFDRPPVTHMPPDVVRAVRSYVTHLDERLAEGRGIWFSGDVGTGKTTLAMLISAEALRQGASVAIYSLPRLLGLLRDTYADTAQYSLNELIDRLAAVDLLHVDDVGAEQTTPWVLEQLYSIVNTRYEDGKAILLTTNLIGHDGSDDALREQIGDRTVSRLYEVCGDPKAMFGVDQRREFHYEPSPAATGGLSWEGDEPAYGEPRPPRRRLAS
jgi:DNA replication protein DnaC